MNTLEEVILSAIAKGFTTFCPTEHISRDLRDFYSEEKDLHTEASLRKLFYDYIPEAERLKAKYKDQIDIFVGFEGEWLRPKVTQQQLDLIEEFDFDLFIGSVHHLHGIPIDISTAEYEQAREISGGTDEKMTEDYFDAVFDMLQALRPPVVGHIDIIKLFWEDPTFELRSWGGVWGKVEKCLRFIVGYGGVLELNAAGFRKERGEPFPGVEICKVSFAGLTKMFSPSAVSLMLFVYQEFKALGGRFTLSDDSHGIHHVGLDYDKVFESIRKSGITELSCMVAVSETVKAEDERFPRVGWKTVLVQDLEGQVETLKGHFSDGSMK